MATENKFTLEDRMAYMRAMDSFFAPKFTPTPKSAASVEAVEQRYLEVHNKKGEYCTLCKKYMYGHKDSALHQTRCREMAAIDEMIGPCSPQSLRRFSSTPGLKGPLNKRTFRAFRGSNVENMTALLLDRLNTGVKIEVAMLH